MSLFGQREMASNSGLHAYLGRKALVALGKNTDGDASIAERQPEPSLVVYT